MYLKAFTAPFSWTSHAVHPLEMMSVPLLLRMHIHVFWIWPAIRQYQGVLDHVGYERLPFILDPFSLCPGIGSTKFHDDHHKHFNYNYASLFSFIDVAFGTDYKGNGEGKQY